MPLASAFPRMQDGETAYYMTDSSLHDLASSLATTSPALLTVERPRASATPRLLDAVVMLTDMGRAVLDAKQDRVTLCGIDKWLGVCTSPPATRSGVGTRTVRRSSDPTAVDSRRGCFLRSL